MHLVCFAVAGIVAVAIGFFQILVDLKLNSLAEVGQIKRLHRTRALSNSTCLVILGWGDQQPLHTDVAKKLLPFSSAFDIEIYRKNIIQDEARHSSLNLFPISPPITLHVSLMPKDNQTHSAVDLLDMAHHVKTALGNGRLSAYVVQRSVYTEYGEYDGQAIEGWDVTATKSSWTSSTTPFANKSPFVIAHTAFPKPHRFQTLSNLEWAHQVWFPKQSPMSEEMQPRARYVRHVVLQSDQGEHTPNFAGIVLESWPSKSHMENPTLFYHAKSVFEVILHMSVMVTNVMRFADLSVLQGVVLEEYL